MTESSNQYVYINSLVTLNISDHYTRVRVQDGPHRVFGALLGKQSGRSISILNSFELVAIEVDKIFVIDEVFFSGRIALFKETFPELDFFGFYITSSNHKETDNQDVFIQRQAMSFNESPLLLKFDTKIPIIGDKLSINIYDSIIDPIDDTNIIFHKIPIKIVSELAEQIGLDYVARLSKTGNGIESTASKYLNSQFSAITTLLQGISLARIYIKAVKENKIEKDLLILKDIYKLCQKLSLVKPQDLIEKESNCLTDQKLMVLLCSLTNVQGTFSNLITKLNVLSNERSASTFSGGSRGGILGTKKFISQRHNS